MSGEFQDWFTNFTGCAFGISDISCTVTVTASSDSEALEVALMLAQAAFGESGLPPHGIRVSEPQMRRMAIVRKLP